MGCNQISNDGILSFNWWDSVINIYYLRVGREAYKYISIQYSSGYDGYSRMFQSQIQILLVFKVYLLAVRMETGILWFTNFK